jgi:hypothetical protein
MPRLTEDLFAVPDGEIYPRWFRAGEVVTGDVEQAARSRGILEQANTAKRPRRRKAMAPPENK